MEITDYTEPKIDIATQYRIDSAREILIEMRQSFAKHIVSNLSTNDGDELIKDLRRIRELDAVLYLIDRYQDWREYLAANTSK